MHIKNSLTLIEKNLKIILGQEKLEANTTILDAVKELDTELTNPSDLLPKQLTHFLKQRSYQKALHFIQNEYKQTSSH